MPWWAWALIGVVVGGAGVYGALGLYLSKVCR